MLEDNYVDGKDYDYLNWRKIPGYNGWYEASVEGDIRSWKNGNHGRRKKPRLLKKALSRKNGTYIVVLCDESGQRTYPVIRLVAMAFLGEIKPGMVVYHKNGNAADNSLNNVAIDTRENAYKKMNKRSYVRKSVLKVDKNGNILDVYKSIKEASKKNFMCHYQITRHCNGLVKYPFRNMDYTFQWDD